jgi:hypothetical protein
MSLERIVQMRERPADFVAFGMRQYMARSAIVGRAVVEGVDVDKA